MNLCSKQFKLASQPITQSNVARTISNHRGSFFLHFAQKSYASLLSEFYTQLHLKISFQVFSVNNYKLSSNNLEFYFKLPSSSIVLISTITSLDNFFLTHLNLSVCSMFHRKFFLAYILTTLNKKILSSFLGKSFSPARPGRFFKCSCFSRRFLYSQAK